MSLTLKEIVQKLQGACRTEDEMIAYEIGFAHGYDMSPKETELTPHHIQEAYNEGYERGYSKGGPHI